MDLIGTNYPQYLVPLISTERNNCTVIALVNATGMPYDEAHEILKLAGRKTGKGTIHEHIDAYAPFSKSYISLFKIEQMNVAKFINTHKTGRWIVGVRKHVFAIIDGIIYDSIKVGTRWTVDSFWEIEINSCKIFK